jgi:hypothetical protein
MTSHTSGELAADAIVQRAEERFRSSRQALFATTDRLFALLMLGQWAGAIALAATLSPYAWAGRTSAVHVHVVTAIVLGGALASVPVALARLRPGSVVTRHVMAAAQMLWSALLIHLSGGRIETHFHVFGSLAFLAFYRDFPVLLTASVVVAAEHFLRGLLWPESVYGIVNPEWWRFLEHAFWVIFIVSFLAFSARKGVREMREIAERGAMLEALSEGEWRRSSVLDRVARGAA